jgi:hypothetical protein
VRFSIWTFRICWQDESDVGVLVDVNAKNRLIILHVGSINGFLQNAELIYKAGNSTGDYHSQMNHVNSRSGYGISLLYLFLRKATKL